MGPVGHISLILTFLLSIVSIAVNVSGTRKRDERYMAMGRKLVFGMWAFSALATAALFYALLTNDFSIKYVEATSRVDQALLYKIGAFWSSQEGSFLLWLFILTTYSAAVARFYRQEAGDLHPMALAVLSGVALFFSFMTAFIADPFESYPADQVPIDGRGLTPLLQDPGMMGHPLLLFTGYVGMAVPFAFGIATLILRKQGNDWLKITRRWTMVAWLFLSMGIVAGAWWAYRELGWGGYWAWDPVENASFMPWLVATAFLHSAMVEERRGLLKNWNMILIIFAFALTIFGTFVVRSGILSSVHAFAQSDIGPWFMGFIGLLLAGCLYLVFDRYEVLITEGSIESVVSKESSFLLNNLLLMAITLTVLLGTTFPLLTKMRGIDVTIGAPYFNAIAGPIFATLILLMGVCPLVAWRRASLKQFPKLFVWPLTAGVVTVVVLLATGINKPGAVAGFGASAFVLFTLLREFLLAARTRSRITGQRGVTAVVDMMNKNPRRWGGYTVHLGIVIMTIGIVGSQFYQTTTQAGGVRVGQEFSLSGYTFQYQGLGNDTLDGGVERIYANVLVKKDGKELGTLRPERRFYPGFEQMGPSTEADIKGTLLGDLYLILGGWDSGGATASFKAWWNPLVGWIWIGLYFLVAGTLFSVWPRTRRMATTKAQQREARAFTELRDLEFDYQMGKVSRDDYLELQDEFTQEAAAVIESQDKGRGRGKGGGLPPSGGGTGVNTTELPR